jgi:hypothetical protein
MSQDLAQCRKYHPHEVFQDSLWMKSFMKTLHLMKNKMHDQKGLLSLFPLHVEEHWRQYKDQMKVFYCNQWHDGSEKNGQQDVNDFNWQNSHD